MANSLKTFVLWVVLILGFLAIYNALASGDGVEPWVVAVALVPVFGVLVYFGRRTHKSATINAEGARHLQSGRYAEALAKFEDAARISDQVAYRYNVTLAQMLLFKFGPAREGLEKLLKDRRVTKDWRKNLELQLMLCRALSGPVDESLGAPTEEEPFSMLVRAVVDARRGRWTEVEAVLGRYEIKQLGGFHRSLADTLAAWSAWELRQERRPIDKVALFGEASDDGLERAWPALMKFIDAA